MKKSLFVTLITAFIVFTLAACGDNPTSTTTEKETSSVAVTETATVTVSQTEKVTEPQTKENTEASTALESVEASSTKLLDETTKASIKEFVEPCIEDTYKTLFYGCDILTPTSGEGAIVSIQIESDSFTDEEACMTVIKNIIGKMLGQEQFKNIHSFEFTMLSDSQVKYMIKVNDAQKITTVDDIDKSADVSSF